VNATPRLLEVSEALRETGVQFLIMGGHAARHYGIDRNTLDVDVHVSADAVRDLEERLRRTRLFSGADLRAGPSWRPEDFRVPRAPQTNGLRTRLCTPCVTPGEGSAYDRSRMPVTLPA
jgi:hypothetical protein